MISAIVAVDADWGIGYNGELLEKIPEDMKRFKELTTGYCVIMGRKTWESLPNKYLPNRRNVVISNSIEGYENDVAFVSLEEGVIPVIEITKKFSEMKEYTTLDGIKHTYNMSPIFIIGGASIYNQLLPYCDTIYLTRIDKHHENVDTYFPDFTQTGEWELTECSGIKFHNDIPYQFETWRRRN